jgi:methyl-accepting chemotaxis protein
MATAKPTSRRGTGTGTKASGKAAATRTTAAKRTTKAKTSTAKARVTLPGSPTVFGDYAERAVLIPVGAALIARDRVMTSVNSTISSYSSSSKAQAQLRRFERRGTTARKSFERELRQRRREIEKTVSDLEARRDAVAKNGTDLANRVPDLANRVPELANRVPDIASQVQERILSLV